MPKSNIFIISGPTGTGESTITKEIIKKFPNFTRLVTATSRSPRLNEKNSVDYYFFSKPEFETEIKAGNILEHTYVENRDVYYGTYKKDLEEKVQKGFNIIINPDIVGTKFYKENYGAITIFIKPESLDDLKKRLVRRDPEISPDELQKRLINAASEIKNDEHFYDYSIINKDGELDQAIAQTAEIIKKYL